MFTHVLRRAATSAAAAFLAALIAACGGNDYSTAVLVAPTIATFTVTPAAQAFGGGQVVLSWSAPGASTVVIDNGVGDVSGLASKAVNVTANTTFTLTASNSYGSATATTAVTVAAQPAPVIASFTATPATLPAGGGSVTLTWATTNATTLAIDNGVGVVTGTSKAVNVAANTTFTLTATNPSGAVTRSSGVTLASASTRYVDVVNGVDTNACTQAAPCKTLANAITGAPAGSTFLLADGMYSALTEGVGGLSIPDGATLQAINPRIVYCSISGYGQDGPYAHKGGHDINYQGYAGILEQSGAAGGEPAPGNFQIGDLAGGVLSAAMGILAALFDAQRSGRGRYIDVAMTDCAMAHAIMPMAALQSYGAGRPMPRGEDYTTGRLPCYGVYATADGRHLALGAIEPHFWQNFCMAAGRPDLIEHGWALGDDAPAAKAEIAALIKSRTLAEWSALLESVDGCATPVLRLDEAIEHPNIRARGMIVDGERPDGAGGRYRQYAFPLKMTDFEFGVERNPPLLGEHNDEVLQALGYGAEDIAALRASGVV